MSWDEALDQKVFYAATEDDTDTHEGFDGWVLVGTGFKLDDGVVVHLGFLRELATSQTQAFTAGFYVWPDLGHIVRWQFFARGFRRCRVHGRVIHNNQLLLR